MTLPGRFYQQTSSPLRQALAPLLAALLMLLSTVVHARAPISTTHDGDIEARHIDYLIDQRQNPAQLPDSSISASKLWRRVERTPVNMGFLAQPIWFRLSLHNPSDRLQERYLEIAHPLLDDVRIFIFSDDTLLESSAFGDAFPFDHRPIEYPTLVKQLHLEPGATLDLLIRVESISSVQFPVALWQGDTLLRTASLDTFLNGIYYGTLLIMLIYNLFAWRNNGNERKYLYYALYITSIGVFFACINGIASQYLWPDWPGFSKRMMVLALGSTVLFGGLFTRSFLGLAASRPGLDRFTLGICALGGLITITGLWLPYSIVIQPLIILVVVAAGTALLSGAIRWHDGHPAAVMFCLAWLILGLGVTALGTNKLGWIPRNPFTEYMAQLGSMLEFILLSLALIRQINIERKAKSEARKTALEFERQANLSRQQALIVQQQAAVELEARVQRRTAELQIANDKLSALSTTDPLTGLKNRRFFNERYLAEFVRSKRDGTPISVLIIDVDHFKSVNDCYGHLLGDEVLKRVAQLIEHEARRECDIVTRHGGEEFSAVLIDNSPLQALAMAEKIRRRIADNAYQDDELSLQCTVSVGVATMTPTPHSSPEELIKQADEALYQSKSTGRNRVSVYSEQAA